MGEVSEVTEAVFATHGGDEIEEGGTGFASGEGHAGGVDEDAGFDVEIGGEASDDGFDTFDVEGVDSSETLDQLVELVG